MTTGAAQIILLLAFLLVIAFGILWIYPAQWFLVQGEGVWKSISRGLATFKKPSQPLRIFLFAALIELVLFLFYVINIMLARNPSIDPSILSARYDSIINIWLAIFRVVSYVLFFGVRLVLYVQNTPAAGARPSSPAAPLKRKPKVKARRKK
jgi:hypothetical protein